MNKLFNGKNLIYFALIIGFLGFLPHTISTLSKTSYPSNPIFFSENILTTGYMIGTFGIILLFFGFLKYATNEK